MTDCIRVETLETVETSVEERRMLRRARQMVARPNGRVYVETDRYQTQVSLQVVESLLRKGLMVQVGQRFERTVVGKALVERCGR